MTKRKKHDLESVIKELEGKLEQECLDQWPLKSLLDFRDRGVRVERTKRGNYRSSRTRPLRAADWSDGELMDWLEDNLLPHRSTRDEEIWSEVYSRWKIPSNYTHEDARNYALNGQEPETTEHGLLANDTRRPVTPIEELTFAELCAIHLGEVESDLDPEVIVKRLMKITRSVTEQHLQHHLNRFKSGAKNMSSSADILIGILEQRQELYRKYGNRVSDGELANNSKVFYNSLRRVMKTDYAEFSEAYRSLLKYVDTNYHKLFSPPQIRRGWDHMELSSVNLSVYDRLLTLIIGTRNGATRRQDVRQYKMDYILEHIVNAKERENIEAFYSE